MKTLLTITLIFLAFFLITGCEDDPVEVHDDLHVELTVSPDHVHTLSEITYTATITDHSGAPVTNLAAVEVQRKAHDSDTWRGTELTLDGIVYKGDYTFSSSGDYDIRVAVTRAGETTMEVVYEMTDHFHVGRAHVEVGNYRVEYENFPGHVHEGDLVTVKFWVMEAEKDASGNRPPVNGLSPEIVCTNSDGSFEAHTDVSEPENGVYQVEHTFIVAGEAHEEIEFTAPDNTSVSADFHFHVAHKH